MYEPIKHEGIFFDYKSTDEILYKEIYGSRPVDKCFVNVYHKGKFMSMAYVWGDSEMEDREYIEINHTVVYLDTLHTLVQVPTIIQHICEQYNVTKLQLQADCRKMIYSEPRNILFYILREEYGLTWESVGDLFHRNHATAMNGHKKVSGMMEVNPKYRTKINSLILTQINEPSELQLE